MEVCRIMRKTVVLPVRTQLPIVSAEKSDSFIRLSNKNRISSNSLKRCAVSLSKFTQSNEKIH